VSRGNSPDSAKPAERGFPGALLPAIRRQSIPDARVDSPITTEYKTWRQAQLQNAANFSEVKIDGSLRSQQIDDIPDTFVAKSWQSGQSTLNARKLNDTKPPEGAIEISERRILSRGQNDNFFS
jgi:hypothetical protein